jgi:hypothetical protein
MRWLSRAAMPWWIAGGWAIDLFLGRKTRDHGDCDIAIRRSDQPALAEALAGWDIRVAADGALTPWTAGDWLEGGSRHQFWARPDSCGEWTLEVLLEEGDERRWRYRRDTGVTLAWHRFGRRTADGVPFVAPEVALLYKARRPDEPKNAADFEATLPKLDLEQKAWLASVLDRAHPDHPWRMPFEIGWGGMR